MTCSPPTESPEAPDPDLDLEAMSSQDLLRIARQMRRAIRAHRDSQGHDLCWFTPELWDLLPDKKDPQPRVPPFGEFIEGCVRYRRTLGP